MPGAGVEPARRTLRGILSFPVRRSRVLEGGEDAALHESLQLNPGDPLVTPPRYAHATFPTSKIAGKA